PAPLPWHRVQRVVNEFFRVDARGFLREHQEQQDFPRSLSTFPRTAVRLDRRIQIHGLNAYSVPRAAGGTGTEDVARRYSSSSAQRWYSPSSSARRRSSSAKLSSIAALSCW